MGSMQGCVDSKRNMAVARKYEQTVFETVVRFVFLLTGRLMYVFNDSETDILGNLAFACMNLAHKLETEYGTKYTPPEQPRKNATGSCFPSASSMGASSVAVLSNKHLRSSSPSNETPHKRTRLGNSNSSVHSSSLRKSILNYRNVLC